MTGTFFSAPAVAAVVTSGGNLAAATATFYGCHWEEPLAGATVKASSGWEAQSWEATEIASCSLEEEQLVAVKATASGG